MPEFGSDKWIPDVVDMCLDFLKAMQTRPGGRFLKFNDEFGTPEKPGRIVEEYHKTAARFKVEVFGDNAVNAYIDYHKIAALYIRAILIHRPFFLDVPDETKYFEVCLYVKNANEYFLISYLEAIFRSWNNDFNGMLSIPSPYLDNFIKLLYHFKKNPEILDCASLSNIIYLIEQKYFQRTVSGANPLKPWQPYIDNGMPGKKGWYLTSLGNGQYKEIFHS
jgi:hypothetical protein